MNIKFWSKEFCLVTLALYLCTIGFAQTTALIGSAQTKEQIRPLPPGQPVEREIAGGESHTYQVPLQAGQFLRVVLEQKGIDLAVALNAPDGKQLVEVNLSGGAFGREQLSQEVATAGAYQIVVRTIAATAVKGNYQVLLELKAAATARDKQQLAAERLLTDAIKFNLQGPAAASQAIEKAQQALALWRELADRYWEASTLNLIGNASLSARKYDQAIEFYSQSLTIRRDIKDRAGEGNTLSNLALTQRTLNHQEKAIQYFEQALVIKRELQDGAGEATTLTNLGLGYENLSRFEPAIEQYTKSLAVRRALKDRAGEANSLNNIGNSYRTMGRYEKAIEIFEQSLKIARDVKDRVLEGTALNGLGGANFGLGRYDSAASYFEQALQIAREVKDRRGEGNALNNLGGTNYSLSRFEKAISYFEQALVVKHELKDRGEAMALSNLGISYQALGQSKRALEYYDRSLALNRELKNRYAEGQALTNLGNVYKDSGHSENALEYYEQALSITREIKDRAGEVAALNNLGAAYYDLGDYEKGFDYQKRALAVSREIKDRYSEGQALGNLGSMCNTLGRYEEAVSYYEQSLAIFREVKNRAGEGVALNGLGYASRLLGRYEPAIGYLEPALAIQREVKNRQGEGYPLNNLGAVQAALGHYDKAIEYFGQALTVEREVKDRLGEAFTLHDFAKAERDRGNLVHARVLIEQALQIVEAARAEIYNPQARASYFASTQKYYKFYIDLLLRLDRENPKQGLDDLAVEASERARARGLLELLTEAGTNIRQGVDNDLLAREQTLARQLNAKATSQMQLLSQANNPEQAAALNQQISQLETDLERAQADIRKASPRYAALVQPQPLKLKEIQAQLDADTLLLEYSLGEERSYLWAITRDSLTSYELPKAELIEKDARQVYELLTARSINKRGETSPQRQERISQAEAKLPAAARGVSQTILAPVAAQLGNKRLVVVADGALQYIPFAMLPEPVGSGQMTVASEKKNSNRPLATDPRPLIVSHEVVSLPSASALAIQRSELAGRQPAPKMLAVIADPVFDQTDPRFKTVAPTSGTDASDKAQPQTQTTTADDARSIEHLAENSGDKSGVTTLRLVIPRLPFTRQEANQLMALAPKGSSFSAIDFQASRATALDPALSQYRYVHIATHGLLDTERPGLSALVFSMVDAEGKPQDGFLRANDIYNLKLPAELVVLSACQTGLGKEIKGEGLVGLTRGFMYAGAARVVVSLWNVNDKATADLMTKFYEKMLKQGARPAAALRAAQVEMWKQKQWQSPYYWAAFTMQGEWR